MTARTVRGAIDPLCRQALFSAPEHRAPPLVSRGLSGLSRPKE